MHRLNDLIDCTASDILADVNAQEIKRYIAVRQLAEELWAAHCLSEMNLDPSRYPALHLLARETRINDRPCNTSVIKISQSERGSKNQR